MSKQTMNARLLEVQEAGDKWQLHIAVSNDDCAKLVRARSSKLYASAQIVPCSVVPPQSLMGMLNYSVLLHFDDDGVVVHVEALEPPQYNSGLSGLH